MSAAGGDAIRMSAVLDLRQPYADLAAFRQAAAQPVTIGAGPVTPGASPATFSSPGGTPFPASLIGPRPTGLGPVALGSGGYGASPGTAQFTAAVQQFTAAMGQFTQAVTAFSGNTAGGIGGGGGESGAGGGGSAGPGGSRGGGRSGNLFTRGFGRLFGGYFLIREATQIAEAYHEYNVDEDINRQRGTETTLARLQREQRLEHAKESIPFYGQGRMIGRMITGDDEEEQLKILEAEDSKRDWESGSRIRSQYREGLVRSQELRRSTDVFGITGSYEREMARLSNQISDQKSRSIAEEQNRLDEIATLSNPLSPLHNLPEAQRKIRELNAWRERNGIEQSDLTANVRAQIGDRFRLNNLENQKLERQISGATLRDQGNIGGAENADFEAQLADKQASAHEAGGGREAIQIILNNLARRGRANQFAFEASMIDRRSEAIGYELDRDPLNAGLSRIQSRFEEERRNAATPEIAAALRRESLREQNRFKQQFDDQTHRTERTLDQESARLDITNDHSATSDPYSRSVRANAFDIFTRAQNQSEDLARSGRAALIPKVLGVAHREFTAQRNSIMDSIDAVEVDPTRTVLSGPGTFNIGEAFKDINAREKDLEKIPKDAAKHAAEGSLNPEDVKNAVMQAMQEIGVPTIVNVLRDIGSEN